MADAVAENAELKQNIEIQAKNLEEANAKLEKLETALSRPESSKSEDVNMQMKAFGNWLRKGEVDPDEKKALYESDDTLGGFYAPAEYVADLIKGVFSLSCETMNQGSTAMQCPPTPVPGCNIFTLGCLLANSIKFHILIPCLSQTIDNSFANAIFTSLKLFSANLHISAVFASVSNKFPLTNVQ